MVLMTYISCRYLEKEYQLVLGIISFSFNGEVVVGVENLFFLRPTSTEKKVSEIVTREVFSQEMFSPINFLSLQKGLAK